MYVCMCNAIVCMTAYVWKSEDNFWELILLTLGSNNWTWFFKLVLSSVFMNWIIMSAPENNNF